MINFEHEDVWKMIVEFIKHHRAKQVPRLQELKRYMLGDNNINYRPNRPEGRSDNRIASGFADFIVSLKLGVLLGNPLKYSGDQAIAEKITTFANQSNEDYHNQLVGRDMIGLGRAYEWVGRDEYGKETLAKFDAEQTFVVYDNTKDRNSLCGVHYYKEQYLGKSWTRVELYTNSGFNHYFIAKDDDLENAEIEEGGIVKSYFDSVQVNEWINNEERLCDFERVLDSIDAYDLSRSEMANFQQDSSEAYLVIKGNPDTAVDPKGKNSQLEVLQAMMRARMLVLGDKKIYEGKIAGAEPNAYYLKKEYDVAVMEANDSKTQMKFYVITFGEYFYRKDDRFMDGASISLTHSLQAARWFHDNAYEDAKKTAQKFEMKVIITTTVVTQRLIQIYSLKEEIKQELDFIVIARPSIKGLTYDEIRSNLVHVLKLAKKILDSNIRLSKDL